VTPFRGFCDVAVIGLAVRYRAPFRALAAWVAGAILAFMARLNHFHLAVRALIGALVGPLRKLESRRVGSVT